MQLGWLGGRGYLQGMALSAAGRARHGSGAWPVGVAERLEEGQGAAGMAGQVLRTATYIYIYTPLYTLYTVCPPLPQECVVSVPVPAGTKGRMCDVQVRCQSSWLAG